MSINRFLLVSPSTRGLSLAITRHLLKTTDLPLFATHRADNKDEIRERILSPLKGVDGDRLRLLKLDLTSEESIAAAADSLAKQVPDDASIHTAFFTGGILHPEKQPADLNARDITETFQINVISHLLLIKHFSRFLPNQRAQLDEPTKWVHMSARVGSIQDNQRGGWYSYRSSKAALNQVIKTFDLQLAMNKTQAMCVGMHPGTVKTDLSKGFWDSKDVKDKAFTPEDAAEKVVGVVEQLQVNQRGKVWDWAGKEVPW
ncbi:hypothetical protein ONZ45_g4561 [Pleurotus djamor]|nr:hypothetical protein ONZ45_g4561 [Pleurotus djamor]